VIDSSCSDRPPGTVLRLTWPDDSVALRSTCSTHGFDVAAALTLAHALGRLPAEVVVFAVEAASCEAREDLSPAVARALPDLRDQVVHEAEMASRSGP
jgi:hydrogenase maturation protease